MSSRSSARRTPTPSVAEAYSRLLATKVSDCTGAGVGLRPEMRRDPLRYVLSGAPRCRKYRLTVACTALRRFGFHQGVSVRAQRLQQGDVVPELHRLHRRCISLARRLSTPRRHQDPYPESELREPGERLPDSVQHGQERRILQFLQGIGTEGQLVPGL